MAVWERYPKLTFSISILNRMEFKTVYSSVVMGARIWTKHLARLSLDVSSKAHKISLTGHQFLCTIGCVPSLLDPVELLTKWRAGRWLFVLLSQCLSPTSMPVWAGVAAYGSQCWAGRWHRLQFRPPAVLSVWRHLLWKAKKDLYNVSGKQAGTPSKKI